VSVNAARTGYLICALPSLSSVAPAGRATARATPAARRTQPARAGRTARAGRAASTQDGV